MSSRGKFFLLTRDDLESWADVVALNRLGNNLAGHYKRGVGMALHIGIGNFGGAIASNIYRTQDAPRYILGREWPFLLSKTRS